MELRAALVFTGHLRGTCDRELDAGLRAIQAQAINCRAVFSSCDVFLHTWDRLEKPVDQLIIARRCGPSCRRASRLANVSSWPCVGRVVAALEPVAAVTVERQDRRPGHAADERRWTSTETLRSFRMNGASMSGGAALVARHAATMNHSYVAAVRMRADLGSATVDGRPNWRDQMLNNRSWRTVRRYATHYDTPAANRVHRQVMTCDTPRVKRMDFCSWSVPATPLLDTLHALSVELAGDAATEAACHAYLNRSFTAPFACGAGLGGVVHSESVLFCAMRRAGVAASGLATNHDFTSHRCVWHRPRTEYQADMRAQRAGRASRRLAATNLHRSSIERRSAKTTP